MTLSQQLYLLLLNPADGDTGTLEYTPIKRALVGALAWELVEAGTARFEGNDVVLEEPTDPDHLLLTAAHRRYEGQLTAGPLLTLAGPDEGLITGFLARKLHEQGLLDEKKVSHLLVFTKTVHPLNAAGEAEAERQRKRFLGGLNALRSKEMPADRAAAVGGALLLLNGVGKKALKQTVKVPSECYQVLVSSETVPAPLMREFAKGAPDDIGDLLGLLDIFT